MVYYIHHMHAYCGYQTCSDIHSLFVVCNVQIRKLDGWQTYLMRFHKVRYALHIFYECHI